MELPHTYSARVWNRLVLVTCCSPRKTSFVKAGFDVVLFSLSSISSMHPLRYAQVMLLRQIRMTSRLAFWSTTSRTTTAFVTFDVLFIVLFSPSRRLSQSTRLSAPRCFCAALEACSRPVARPTASPPPRSASHSAPPLPVYGKMLCRWIMRAGVDVGKLQLTTFIILRCLGVFAHMTV